MLLVMKMTGKELTKIGELMMKEVMLKMRELILVIQAILSMVKREIIKSPLQEDRELQILQADLTMSKMNHREMLIKHLIASGRVIHLTK